MTTHPLLLTPLLTPPPLLLLSLLPYRRVVDGKRLGRWGTDTWMTSEIYVKGVKWEFYVYNVFGFLSFPIRNRVPGVTKSTSGSVTRALTPR